MRSWLKHAAVRLVTAASEPLIGFPFYVLVPAYTRHFERMTLWFVLIFVCFFFGMLLRSLTVRLPRGVLIFGIAALSVGLSIGVWGGGRTSFLAIIVYALACGRGAWREQVGVRASQYWLLPVLYAFMSIIMFQPIRELQPYAAMVLWSGLICMLLALIISNVKTLQIETLSRIQGVVKLPNSVRSMNRLLLGVVFVLIAVISLFKWIGNTFQWLFRTIMLALYWLYQRFNLSFPVRQEPRASLKPETVPQQLQETSLIWRILEKIVLVGIYALIAAGAVALLYFLARQGYLFMRQLVRYLSSADSAGVEKGEGYIDEWSSTRRSLNDSGNAAKGKLRSSQREPGWESMADRDKIRYLYRQLLKRWTREGHSIDPAWTPREAVEKAEHRTVWRFTELYESVRYGGQNPDGAEPEQWRQEMQKNNS